MASETIQEITATLDDTILNLRKFFREGAVRDFDDDDLALARLKLAELYPSLDEHEANVCFRRFQLIERSLTTYEHRVFQNRYGSR